MLLKIGERICFRGAVRIVDVNTLGKSNLDGMVIFEKGIEFAKTIMAAHY